MYTAYPPSPFEPYRVPISYHCRWTAALCPQINVCKSRNLNLYRREICFSCNENNYIMMVMALTHAKHLTSLARRSAATNWHLVGSHYATYTFLGVCPFRAASLPCPFRRCKALSYLMITPQRDPRGTREPTFQPGLLAGGEISSS